MDLDIRGSLKLLNFFLQRKNEFRSFTICGGASLFLQGIVNRTTRDVDIVGEELDDLLKEAAVSVAGDLGLKSEWLNAEPKALSLDMKPGWEQRVFLIFEDTHLKVYSISRSDMIFSKFYAYCDRQKDMQDLISLKVTKEELFEAKEFTKLKDGNPLWPAHVEQQAKKLELRLKHE